MGAPPPPPPAATGDAGSAAPLGGADRRASAPIIRAQNAGDAGAAADGRSGKRVHGSLWDAILANPGFRNQDPFTDSEKATEIVPNLFLSGDTMIYSDAFILNSRSETMEARIRLVAK